MHDLDIAPDGVAQRVERAAVTDGFTTTILPLYHKIFYNVCINVLTCVCAMTILYIK